jgi:glucosamine kinase
MFFLVESGSTKADWLYVGTDGSIQQFQTEGVNPATQQNLLDLHQYPEIAGLLREAQDVYFYGAGVVGEASINKVQSWLRLHHFKGNGFIYEDLLGAARACFGDSEGIVCILGTGSNSCVYDGNKFTRAIPTLGFMFSDEGGGVHIGKEVIRSYFYGLMPEKEHKLFQETFGLTKELLIKSVYGSTNPSRYIASFASFMTHTEGSWKNELIKKVFREFVELRILPYPEHTNMPVRFVGSVAHYHQAILKDTLQEYGISTDEVIQQPIHHLLAYHLKQRNR